MNCKQSTAYAAKVYKFANIFKISIKKTAEATHFIICVASAYLLVRVDVRFLET